jgi:hypothetical protein
MRIFDIHTHVFPDAIAARTVEMLGEKAGIEPVYDGARAGLIEQMRSAGIKAALNCPIATRPEQVSSINRWAAENNTAPVYSLGTVHPETEDKAGVLASVEANGLPGIKLHPEYQQFDLLDERMAPVWTLCEREGLMIMLHAGADIAFEPPYRSDPARIRQLIERYPELKLVAAHFGSWRMWEVRNPCIPGYVVHTGDHRGCNVRGHCSSSWCRAGGVRHGYALAFAGRGCRAFPAVAVDQAGTPVDPLGECAETGGYLILGQGLGWLQERSI